MIPEISDERQMRALTGVPTEKLSSLEAAFALALDDEKEKSYREGLAKGERQAVDKKVNCLACMTSWFFFFII